MQRLMSLRDVGTLSLLAPAVLLLSLGAAPDAPYRDPKLPVEERVKDLVGRMTLEEKVAQTLGLLEAQGDDHGRVGPLRAGQGARRARERASARSRGRASCGDTPDADRARARARTREFVNAVQKWLVENTRLGIPAMTHEEALHGLAAPKGTHFPIPIAPGQHLGPRARRAGDERGGARGARPRHAPRALAGARPRARPALGPHRGDLRRGPVPRRAPGRRGHPRLPGHGACRSAKDKVFATAKHFAVHGPHEGGINTAPVDLRRAHAARPVPVPVRGGDPRGDGAAR